MTFHSLFKFREIGTVGLFAVLLAIFFLSLVEIDVLDAFFAFFAVLWFRCGQKSVLEVTVVASSWTRVFHGSFAIALSIAANCLKLDFEFLVETEAGWRRTFVLDGSLARTSFGDVYFRSVVFGIAADSGAFVLLCHLA